MHTAMSPLDAIAVHAPSAAAAPAAPPSDIMTAPITNAAAAAAAVAAAAVVAAISSVNSGDSVVSPSGSAAAFGSSLPDERPGPDMMFCSPDPEPSSLASFDFSAPAIASMAFIAAQQQQQQQQQHQQQHQYNVQGKDPLGAHHQNHHHHYHDQQPACKSACTMPSSVCVAPVPLSSSPMDTTTSSKFFTKTTSITTSTTTTTRKAPSTVCTEVTTVTVTESSYTSASGEEIVIMSSSLSSSSTSASAASSPEEDVFMDISPDVPIISVIESDELDELEIRSDHMDFEIVFEMEGGDIGETEEGEYFDEEEEEESEGEELEEEETEGEEGETEDEAEEEEEEEEEEEDYHACIVDGVSRVLDLRISPCGLRSILLSTPKPDSPLEVETCAGAVRCKRVSFKADDALADVHVEDVWCEELAKERRDGRIWQEAALDRDRFLRRIDSVKDAISKSLVKKADVRADMAARTIQAAFRGYLCRRHGPLAWLNRYSSSEACDRKKSRAAAKTVKARDEGISYAEWQKNPSRLSACPPSSGAACSKSCDGKRRPRRPSETDGRGSPRPSSKEQRKRNQRKSRSSSSDEADCS